MSGYSEGHAHREGGDDGGELERDDKDGEVEGEEDDVFIGIIKFIGPYQSWCSRTT